MVEKHEPSKRAEAVESLTADVKTEVETFLKHPDTFQAPGYKLRMVNLDPKALAAFYSLPINGAQITDAKMVVVITEQEETSLKVEREGKTTDTFTITKPKTTSVYLNFRDSKKPHITFLYTLDLKDGQTPRGAYIKPINSDVDVLDAGKPSVRANIASELNSVKQLLRSQNNNRPSISQLPK